MFCGRFFHTERGEFPRLTWTMLAIVLLCGSQATAQEAAQTLTASVPTTDQRSPAASFEIALTPADDAEIVTLTVEATIADGWHIYPLLEAGLNTPTKITFEPIGLEAVDPAFQFAREPGHKKELSGTFSWTRQYKVAKVSESYSGSGSIRFQACDATMCLPPQTLAFDLSETGNSDTLSTKAETDNGDVIELKTEACSATRPPSTFSMSSIFAGRKDETLNRKCCIEVEGQKIDIYLPKADQYTIENSSPDNTMISNTSTYISIDQNGDGKLEDHEAMPTNLPIRILDSMYQVTGIADDASSISLVKSDGPLFGTVLNRKCPEFSFQTVDGDRTISDKSILGKVTLLDIWAVT